MVQYNSNRIFSVIEMPIDVVHFLHKLLSCLNWRAFQKYSDPTVTVKENSIMYPDVFVTA